MGVLDDVRNSCAEVMAHSRFVRIEQEALKALALRLLDQNLALPSYDLEHHFRGSEDETAAFVLVLDAVNFGSGYFPFLRKPGGLSGYFTIASAIQRRFADQGAWSADELIRIQAEDCAAIFEQDLEIPAMAELMRLFSEAWQELGRCVRERYAGNFAALIRAAQGSAERLVSILSEQPFYRDESTYRGKPVFFFKRAQITVIDLVLAFEARGLGEFSDLDSLTIFADNLVPHVLRLEGVLSYDDSLLSRIETGELIAAGSPEEVEIRAAGVHAVEGLVAEMQNLGRQISSVLLDQRLWSLGQAPEIKRHPRHRTRSIFY